MNGNIVGVANWIDGPTEGTFALRMTAEDVSAVDNYINFGSAYEFASGQNGFTVFMQLRFMPVLVTLTNPMNLLSGPIGLKINTGDLTIVPGVSATIKNLTMQLLDKNGTDYIRRSCPGGISWESEEVSYHTIAISYNGKKKASGCRIYFDGLRRDSNSSASKADETIDFLPTGNVIALDNCPMDVAEIRFFNTALAAKAILNLHNAIQGVES